MKEKYYEQIIARGFRVGATTPINVVPNGTRITTHDESISRLKDALNKSKGDYDQDRVEKLNLDSTEGLMARMGLSSLKKGIKIPKSLGTYIDFTEA